MNNNELFENTSIPKAYFTMALPVVFSMVISLVYNMADTYFVAKTMNTNLVAGVSLCAPIFTFMIALGDIFGIGGSSVISRLFGQQMNKEAKNVSGFCFYASILCGIVVTIFMFILKDPILNFLGVNKETWLYASQYYNIIVLGSTFIILSLTPSNLIRTEGLATLSMVGTVLGSILNIILDPIFIFSFHMGAQGAALASVIGYILSDFLLIYFTRAKTNRLSVSFKDCHIERKKFLDIFTIGIPASITNLMSSIGVALTNRYLVVFGNENVAAMGIALKVNMILLLIIVGFAFGAQPLLGFNYGAKNTERLRAFIKFDIFIEVTFALITAIILSVFAPYIIQSFMNDAQIIQTGSLMLRLLVLSSPCVGIILVFTTLFQSEGKALPALILSISRQGVIYVICIVILSKLFTFHGILISQATADVVTAIIAILIYSKQKTVTR